MEYSRDILTGQIVDCAFQIHKKLGSGLLESAYQQCMAIELAQRNISFEREKPIPFTYSNQLVEVGFRADFIINNEVIIELKSIERLMPIHDAQLITYMKLANIKKGLLINFNVDLIKNGIKRLVL